MSEDAYKKKVLEKLNYLKDEPDIKSEKFQFKEFALQLEKFVLNPDTPSPYTIGLHGEWGGGKTSLIRRVYEQVSSRINDAEFSATNWKAIWFDAWEYEMLDPALALMQKIELTYKGNRAGRQILTASLLTFSDILLRTYTPLSTKEIKDHYRATVQHIATVSEKLRNIIGNKGRLIIFIDDLDRCLIENVLNMLETIKQLLSVKGVIFVIAVDMNKLERAWELRYKGSETALLEGREHIEKIFQLKLSLPPKTSQQIRAYVDEMAKSFGDDDNIRKFIIDGCPPNPRKIKRIINLIIFLSSFIAAAQFKEQLPLIVIWSIYNNIS